MNQNLDTHMMETEKFKVHASRRLCSAVLCAFVDNHQRLRRSTHRHPLPPTHNKTSAKGTATYTYYSSYVCVLCSLFMCVCALQSCQMPPQQDGQKFVCLFQVLHLCVRLCMSKCVCACILRWFYLCIY